MERLSIPETGKDGLQRAFNKVARWIFERKKTGIQPDDISEPPVQPLAEGINGILQDGFNRGIGHGVPYVMKRNLSGNVYVFSGAKTYAELKELSENLLDGDGNIKPFSRFLQDAQKVHAAYNEAYLQAEYIYATQAAQMASKWNDFEQDGDRYNLQYRTANDDRVRESHIPLHDITLPPSDPFWDKYFPPNGWRCRCTAVQVRKGKYPESNSEQALQSGADATSGKQEILRFNPGKQQVVFPPHHPYMKILSGAERETLEKKAAEAFEVKTADDVVNVVNQLAKDRNWFERGFNKLEVTGKKGVNGSTDMNGKIWLTKERLDETVSGINKLSKGEQITFKEADSLSVFWHEVTHNRSKKGSARMTKLQTRYMELANEFVARNTLDEFYGAFGSKVQYPELITNREKTGYNRMVRNYQHIISKTGLDREKVAGAVKKHLFDEAYTDQKNGLAKALESAKKKDGTKLKKAEINSLLKECMNKKEDDFEDFINNLIIH